MARIRLCSISAKPKGSVRFGSGSLQLQKIKVRF